LLRLRLPDEAHFNLNRNVLSGTIGRAARGRTLSLLLAITSTLLLAACGSGGSSEAPPIPTGQGYRGTVLPDALPKPGFTLVDTSGAFYNFASETEGYVTLVYFGYTHCPDVCPDHMANIAAVLKRLPDDVSGRVKTVFVTVDPERDDRQRLRQWLDLFDPSFVGLMGNKASVDSAVKQALGELYFPITREDLGNGNYSVSHAAFVLAYTPDNLAHTVYPFGMQQEDWEHDLYKLVSQGWVEPPALVGEPSSPTEPSVGAAAPSLTPAAEEPAETPAPTRAGPHRLKPEEAQKLISGGFAAVTFEEVGQSIDEAFDKRPDAARFMSQGLILTREKLDLEYRICGSRPEGGSTDSTLLACSTLGGCARLARILYDYYMQSGYEEFYQAALNVYNFVGTSLPDEAEAFTLIVRSELRLTGLPSN
jgi:protein SCO1/2